MLVTVTRNELNPGRQDSVRVTGLNAWWSGKPAMMAGIVGGNWMARGSVTAFKVSEEYAGPRDWRCEAETQSQRVRYWSEPDTRGFGQYLVPGPDEQAAA
jgi:hypothetical protein